MSLLKTSSDEESISKMLRDLLMSEGGKITGGKLAHAGYLGAGAATTAGLMRWQKRRLRRQLEKVLGKKWYQPKIVW